MQAFSKLKQELTNPSVLAHYNPNAETKVSADAMHVSFQQPFLNFIKSSLILATGCTHTTTYHRYINPRYLGSISNIWNTLPAHLLLEGHAMGWHSVPFLTHKYRDSLPPKVLHFRVRLIQFDFVIVHVTGKSLHNV